MSTGHCLDDVAEYLSVEDIDNDTTGDQLVTTHTIGFAIDLPILKETAINSGGKYFLADDVELRVRPGGVHGRGAGGHGGHL